MGRRERRSPPFFEKILGRHREANRRRKEGDRKMHREIGMGEKSEHGRSLNPSKRIRKGGGIENGL